VGALTGRNGSDGVLRGALGRDWFPRARCRVRIAPSVQDRPAEAKVLIAKAAASFVGVGDSVGLNGGTTTGEVARVIGRSDHPVREDGEVAVTLVTNALNISYELSVRSHVTIVVTGGVTRPQSYELVGSLVSDTLSNLTLDVAILGVDGLSAQFGLTTLHEGEADMSHEFVKVARRVIVVAGSTKMGKSTFARICPLDAIDILVTDAPVDGALAEAGVSVVVAGH
jgi:DeoR family transcriptional regulator of aga operon